MTISDKTVNDFELQDCIEELSECLSQDRLATYLNATDQDRLNALRLYAWNTAVSSGFYAPLQALEVVLRNAMHRELSTLYGVSWYDNPATGLDLGCRSRIRKCRDALRKDGYRDDPPQIVASLSFGFWVSLLGAGGRLGAHGSTKANYEMTLWRPALRKSFPHVRAINRKQVHKPLDQLRRLRNRIAHHEPIFTRDLNADFANILIVTGWIEPKKRSWLEAYSKLPEILAMPKEASSLRF